MTDAAFGYAAESLTLMDAGMRFTLIAMMACFALTSCASDQERLANLVEAKVKVGMPVASAIEALRTEGFSCKGEAPIRCGRRREPWLTPICYDNVYLRTEPGSDAIESAQILPIRCATF